MPSFPTLDDRLTDGTVELRLASEYDIPDTLIAHQDDPALYLRLGLERPPSGAQLGSAYERAEAERLKGAALRLTILAPGAEDCLGQVDVHGVDWERRAAELGIWVAPARRGRHVGRRALSLAARWLFEAAELTRLTLLTEPDNEPMLRAARAAGFRLDPGPATAGLSRLSLLPGDLPRD